MSAADGDAVLEVQGVDAYRGPAQILRGVSLAVRRGEAVCLVGRNGAGKTTTIDSIIGLLPVRAGRVLFRGLDVTRRPAHERARLGMGYAPEDAGIFPDLTVEENFQLTAWLSGGERAGAAAGAREQALAIFPEVRNLGRRRGLHLSGGQKKMVAIARAMALRPAVLRRRPSLRHRPGRDPLRGPAGPGDGERRGDADPARVGGGRGGTRRALRGVGGVALAGFLLAAFTPLPGLLSRLLARPGPLAPAAAIVVLGGGGVRADGSLSDTSLRRTLRGLELYQAGLAPLLVLAGPRSESGHVEAEARAALARRCGIPEAAMLGMAFFALNLLVGVAVVPARGPARGAADRGRRAAALTGAGRVCNVPDVDD